MEDIITNIENISKEEGESLVKLAKNSIKHFLETKNFYKPDEIPYKIWQKKGASFITIERKDTGELRGCIGSIVPFRPLYEDVIYNAVAAATKDPRFLPVSLYELPQVRTKVSILSFPKKLEYTSPEDLLNKITPYKDGLILKIGNNQGTFLPDVWEDIPDKESFLSNLCLKAGLRQDCWIKNKPDIFVYHTKVYSD